MKHTLLASALVAVLFSYAAAQDLSAPKASLDPEPARSSNLASPSQKVPGPPSFCKPCLFYAGDFVSNASDANGLANEKDCHREQWRGYVCSPRCSQEQGMECHRPVHPEFYVGLPTRPQ